MSDLKPKHLHPDACKNCWKLPELCMCAELKKLTSKHHVLIIQHPQEPDKDLGSARIAQLSLPNATMKIGLSWPSLKAALGREAQPSKWAVLYLGSGVKTLGAPADAGAKKGGKKDFTSVRPEDLGRPAKRVAQFILVDKKGAPLPDSDKVLKELEGIVVLDGTWSQAKTLWWRNAWLLKLRRAVLIPAQKSLYGELRKEPRRECLSTIESIAEGFEALKEPKETTDGLREIFKTLLDKQRARRKNQKAARTPNEA